MEKQQITVIAGTNRRNSNSALVARAYAGLLDEEGAEAKVLNLEEMPHDFLISDMYGLRSERVQEIIYNYMARASKLVFIIPEYNGSFPGILKAFIDCMDPKLFRGKKAGLVGLSAGRAGSLLAMDHFTGILHYLRVQVHYSKPKLSMIDSLIDEHIEDLEITTVKKLRDHAREIIAF